MRELLRESTSYRRRGTHPSGPRVSCNMFFQATLCFVCACARTVEREGAGGDLKLGKIPSQATAIFHFGSSCIFQFKNTSGNRGEIYLFLCPRRRWRCTSHANQNVGKPHDDMNACLRKHPTWHDHLAG